MRKIKWYCELQEDTKRRQVAGVLFSRHNGMKLGLSISNELESKYKTASTSSRIQCKSTVIWYIHKLHKSGTCPIDHEMDIINVF